MQSIKIVISILMLLQSNYLLAESCEQTIEGNDMLQFNLKEMAISSNCSELTVILKHAGQLPVNIMGHNWVLTDTNDFMAVAQAGGAAGPAAGYLPEGDSRVIAASSMIGGGETTSITFSTSNLAASGDYTFFCSFPGHYAIMKGSFKIID